MKKILLGTTTLIGAATLFAGAAFAGEDPKVTVGGFSNFEAGVMNDDFDQNQRSHAFRNENEIHFNVAGKTDGGLGYGAEIDLQADINGNGPSDSLFVSGNVAPGSSDKGLNARRTYGWLQGDNWGHLEFGSNDGAARTLKVDASNIARATGGIDGDWNFFANVNVANTTTAGGSGGSFSSAGAALGQFITAPRLPVEHGPTSQFVRDTWGNNDKITYYTPRFSGFQIGVSYAPDLTNRGVATQRLDNISGNASDVFSGGINYEGQFDQVGVAVAFTGETASSDAAGINDIGAWNGGAKLSYMGFSVAGSYGDWSDSLNVNTTDATYWTAGAAYETGPFGASLTYLSSTVSQTGSNDSDFQNVSLGLDYKLAPGLTPFAEYTWYDIDANTAGLQNKGGVLLIGSQLSF